jgi:hypothetical protein
MAIQTINVGTLANDGTGDNLREALIKINENFDELDTRTESTTAVNLGNSGYDVFKEQSGSELRFRKLLPGENISMTVNENNITIASVASDFIIQGSNGSIAAGGGSTVEFNGTGGTTVTVDNNAVPKLVSVRSRLQDETQPQLGANIDLNVNGNDIYSVTKLNSITMSQLEAPFNFDFGSTDNTVNNIFEFIVNETDIDMGTITSPAVSDVDFGEGFLVTEDN